MTADSPSEPDVAASPSDENSRVPNSLGDVARRIRSRTTDLLAIAVVLMGGLAVGGKVHRWWNAGDPAHQDPAQEVLAQQGENSTWGADGIPVEFSAGDSPLRITRLTFPGDRPAARQQIVQACRNIVKAASRPATLSKAAENRMLSRLERFTPVEKQAGRWRVYRFDGPVLMATAVRRFQSDGEPGGKTGNSANRADAKSPYRVVCWGMAFPSGQNRWTLFTFQAADRPTGHAASQQLVVDAPANTQRVFSLRDDRNQSWLTFRGRGPLEDWMRFYDEQAEAGHWQRETGWQYAPAGDRAQAVYIDRRRQCRIAISFATNAAGAFTGTVVVTPVGGGAAER